jgi:transcriptional/translational regulatory protein YebC/TACO1
VDEEKLLEAALELGAEDVITHEDGSKEVVTGPYEWRQIKDALAAQGFASDIGEVTMRPANDIELSGEDAVKMQRLIDALEDLDDVQTVYTSASLAE